MKKVLIVLAAVVFLSLPVFASAGEGPMKLPAGSNPEANMHNEEGIKHFNQGHYKVALKHFKEAAAVDSSIAEIHFNEAVTLDKMGQHGEATMHFKAAKKHAKGNEAIINSPILNAHIGH